MSDDLRAMRGMCLAIAISSLMWAVVIGLAAWAWT
jgi:hypothetical protein